MVLKTAFTPFEVRDLNHARPQPLKLLPADCIPVEFVLPEELLGGDPVVLKYNMRLVELYSIIRDLRSVLTLRNGIEMFVHDSSSYMKATAVLIGQLKIVRNLAEEVKKTIGSIGGVAFAEPVAMKG